MPAARVYSFWLDEDLIALVDRRAHHEGVSRNRLVRRMLRASVADGSCDPAADDLEHPVVAEQPAHR